MEGRKRSHQTFDIGKTSGHLEPAFVAEAYNLPQLSGLVPKQCVEQHRLKLVTYKTA